jgi:hypothetical protein
LSGIKSRKKRPKSQDPNLKPQDLLYTPFLEFGVWDLEFEP